MGNKPLLFLMLFLAFFSVAAEEEYYTCYGFVPSSMWHVGDDEITNIQRNATLTIVGFHDDTEAEVYSLPDKTLMARLTLNRMEKAHVLLPNGTFFKLVTNRPVFALLTSGYLNTSSLKGPLPVGFHPSVEGAPVGKEFIFMAGEFDLKYVVGGWGEIGAPYRLLALEDATVRVEDEDGEVIDSFELSANSWKDLALKSFRVYCVTSTGNIMIQTLIDIRSVYIPSVTGSYVGKAFYTISNTRWNSRFHPGEKLGFYITALNEDAKVSIYDVEFGKKIQELTVPAGKGVFIKPRPVRSPPEPPLVLQAEIFIESDKPIAVSYVDHGSQWDYGTGLMFLTVKPGEPTRFYVPINCTAKAYLFTYKETIVVLDQLRLKMPADGYLPIQQGIHEISADSEVVIQVVHWPNIPASQRIASFASIIPSSQSARMTVRIRLTPLAGEETPIMLYAGIATVAAALAVIFFLYRSRRHKSGTSTREAGAR